MPDESLTPAYDKAACLPFVLDEMEQYLTSPTLLIARMGSDEMPANNDAILPMLFDARVMHARCLYEFFHNTRSLSKEGNKVYNGINILAIDYGYESVADKRRFYRLKTMLDEQVVHLTFVRGGRMDRQAIMTELDDYLLPDIAGFLRAALDRAEYSVYRQRMEAILSKSEIK